MKGNCGLLADGQAGKGCFWHPFFMNHLEATPPLARERASVFCWTGFFFLKGGGVQLPSKVVTPVLWDREILPRTCEIRGTKKAVFFFFFFFSFLLKKKEGGRGRGRACRKKGVQRNRHLADLEVGCGWGEDCEGGVCRSPLRVSLKKV